MSTVASIASCPTGTVATGDRATALSGPSSVIALVGEAGPDLRVPDDRERRRRGRSAVVRARARSTLTPGSPNRRRPSRSGASGAQNVAGRMIADTGVVPTSCRPCTVCPARVRRWRIVWAT